MPFRLTAYDPTMFRNCIPIVGLSLGRMAHQGAMQRIIGPRGCAYLPVGYRKTDNWRPFADGLSGSQHSS